MEIPSNIVLKLMNKCDFSLFFLGYVLSTPVQQTVPVATISPPHTMQQFPFLRRDLLVSHGRINYNSNYAFSPNAEDLPCNYHKCVVYLL